jgi:hypothetical protein
MIPAPASVLLLLTAALAGQDPGPITEERVREIVTWLASDERQGRDSPSPGLEATAEYLAQRFAEAGLEQAVEGSWRHRYTLPGLRLDSSALKVHVRVTERLPDGGEKKAQCELEPVIDVRLLRPGEAASGDDQEATIAYADDPRVERLLMAGGGRQRPVLLEVGDDHPSWIAAAGTRDVLGARLRGARPVLLVRKGRLPPVEKPDEARFEVTWSAPWQAVEIPLANVAGVLRGKQLPDEYVIVSAHYDHIGVGRAVDGDAIRNGADDDASGTTAVVLLAAALAKGPPPRRSVAFVCFSAEEKGLRGSAAFAEQPPFPLANVVANLNIEMIGRPEPDRERCAWITGSEYSDFAAIAAAALQRAGITVVPFAQARQLFAQSDNLSFARMGVVAHSISAGSLHADYHQPSDEVAKLDLPHMTAVIRGLLEVVREFADRDARPAWTEEGRRVVERLGRR